MTDQEKIIELAKLDGWVMLPAGKTDFGGSYPPLANRGHETITQDKLPSYLASYDAIIPLIQKQDKETRETIAVMLWKILGIDSDWLEQEAWAKNMLTTPSQLCDAILKSKGILK